MFDSDDDNKIGYGNPPKRHRFKPGQSGNPKGRPRGSRNLATIFREISSQKVKVKDSRGTRHVPRLEVILTQLMNKAALGDHKATQEILRLSQSLPEDPKLLLRAPPFVIRFIKPKHDPSDGEH